MQEFTGLVRSGAYLAGNRAVRPKERSQWRFTFRRLLAQSRASLAAPDPAAGEAALTEMIDLACTLRDYEYVRSQDPIEAAAVVVSDEVAVLWRHLLDHRGFAGFAAVAAAQFLRWESRYGWTRGGWGTISERERPLVDVLAELLTVPDTWGTFVERYLQVLDGAAPPPPAVSTSTSRRRSSYEVEHQQRELEYRLSQRTERMIGWHLVLLDQLAGSEDDALMDRLAGHASLGGPEHPYFRARLAVSRGDLSTARRLIHEALERLPGHRDFLDLAREIDAPLPADAVSIAASRRLPES